MDAHVKDCNDCRFQYCDEARGEVICNAPAEKPVYHKIGKYSEWEDNTLVTPEWCPLKKESITITLIKNEG